MSHSLLEKILINKVNVDINLIIQFLDNYKKDDYIYPSVLKRKLKIDEKETYKVLSILEKNNLIKLYYQYYCYNCNNTSELYEYYSKLPDTFICRNCEEILTLNNVKIVYKVV